MSCPVNPCKTLKGAIVDAGFSCNSVRTTLFGSTPVVTGTWSLGSNKQELYVWEAVVTKWVMEQKCPIEMTYDVFMSMSGKKLQLNITVTFTFPQDPSLEKTEESTLEDKLTELYNNVQDIYALMIKPHGINNSNIRFVGRAINYGPKNLLVQFPRRGVTRVDM